MQCQAVKTTVCLLTILLYSQLSLADDWKLEKQKNDVSIYSQQTDSGYKEIRVKTIVNTTPHALIALFDDVAFTSKWIHNCIEAKIITEVSPTERIVNTFFAAPWPVKDRDMVTYSIITSNDDNVQIEISDRSDSIASNPDYVRMQNMHGLWQAKVQEDGTSEVTYTGGGNPGGSLPAFIANKELITSMFNTFQNLKSVILLDKYQPIKK